MSLVLSLGLIVTGSLVLLCGVELVLRAARAFLSVFQHAEFVYGLTIAAFVTSAPELLINVLYASRGYDDLVAANVVGSNLFNVLLVLGLAAVSAGVRVGERIFRRTLPLLALVSAGVLPLSWDFEVGRMDGFILLLAGIAFLLFTLQLTDGHGDLPPLEAPSLKGTKRVSLLAAGCAVLLVGSYVVVLGGESLDDGTTALARTLSANPTLLGLTILAVGTSLPEFVLGIGAITSRRGELFAGTVLGSCIFNVTFGLGTAASTAGGLATRDAALPPALLLSLLAALGCLGLLAMRPPISRALGVVFAASYVAFISWLALDAVESASARVAYTIATVGCLLPLPFAAFGLIRRRLRREIPEP